MQRSIQRMINKKSIKVFFDENYASQKHYWWKKSNRYSTDENVHTPFYATILREAKKMGSGSVLDIGAGEGADSVRLALLGFEVDAVEISSIGCDKIRAIAREMSLSINVSCVDILDFLPVKKYDIVLCNGILHYISDKERAISIMQSCTNPRGINSISLFSNYSQIPACHQIVDVYPDDEHGVVEKSYRQWENIFSLYDRNHKESSHDEMEEHVHSFIKMIWRKPNE